MNSRIVALFQPEACFQLTNRPFFLCGELLSGELLRGHFLDLTPLGIAKQVRIEEIEFIRKNKNGEVVDIRGLGTTELNEQEKAHLKQIQEFHIPLHVLNHR
jgi:hypothetical protein